MPYLTPYKKNITLFKNHGMKTYSATYKIFENKKLKQVWFHNHWQYPLYIQLVFNRGNTIYKCNLFDLFLQPKYAIRVSGELYPPSIKQIIAKEEKLVEFIIDKHADDFSLALFKKEYDFYSKEILNLIEPDFLSYVYTFLQDEGLPYLAGAIGTAVNENIVRLFEIILDFKLCWNEKLYKRLTENAIYYAPPYLPITQFLQKPSSEPLKCLTVMDWNTQAVKSAFTEFLESYPGADPGKILETIDLYVERLKE